MLDFIEAVLFARSSPPSEMRYGSLNALTSALHAAAPTIMSQINAKSMLDHCTNGYLGQDDTAGHWELRYGERPAVNN